MLASSARVISIAFLRLRRKAGSIETQTHLFTNRVAQLQCHASRFSSSSSSGPATMLAIQVNEIGDESTLTMNASAAVPRLTLTQCLVENHYAGLNFHDTYTRVGLYPMRSFPFTVGCEGGGIVKEVGDDVTEVRPGDRVVYLQEGPEGSYAQYTNVECARLMPVPDDVELDVATAAAVQGLTAHYLVNDSFVVREGDWVVIHAAAGGTGQILVQMAKAKGARVIGTCSSEYKAEIARKRGCDFVIVTKSSGNEGVDDDVWPRLADMVKDIIRENADEPIVPSNYGTININDGAHVVFDSVGRASALASLECLRPLGTAVFFGNASGAPPDIDPLLLSRLGSLSMTRPKLHDFIRTRSEVVQRSGVVFQMLKRRELDLNIQEKIDFTREGVVRGTKMLQERKTVGKILFDIKRGLRLYRKHQKAAEYISASRKANPSDGEKISRISGEVAPQTLEEAYNVQELVKDAILLECSGTKVVGKKIAATSVMAQNSVSVDEPFYGNLFSRSTFASGATISIDDVALGLQEGFLLIEPEFAVRMNVDTEAGLVYTPETIKSLVGSVIPSVEIATSAFVMSDLEAFKKLGAPSLIADNACHGALVLGNELVGDSADGDVGFRNIVDNLGEHTCKLEVNGNKLADGAGEQVLGHPANALCWLANALGRCGKILRRGDIVTTGVCVDRLVLAKRGDSVSVDYGNLGKVTFNFA